MMEKKNAVENKISSESREATREFPEFSAYVDAILAKLVVAVGMFALPSTVLSLFSGQHSWYNISYGEKLPYIKCCSRRYIR